MTMRDLNYWIELLFRRKNAFLETAGIILGLVVLGTLLWPPVYQSTAKIFVQNNRAQLLVSPDLQTESSQNPGIVANPVSEQDLNSEVELLTSLHLVKQAIAGLPMPCDSSLLQDTVGLALQLPSSGYRLLHDSPTLDPRDQWALKLASHVTSRVIKRSNIIEVDFRAHDSRWSHEFLSRLITQYHEYHADSRTTLRRSSSSISRQSSSMNAQCIGGETARVPGQERNNQPRRSETGPGHASVRPAAAGSKDLFRPGFGQSAGRFADPVPSVDAGADQQGNAEGAEPGVAADQAPGDAARV